jgi:Tfp pilus assembly protein PilE
VADFKLFHTPSIGQRARSQDTAAKTFVRHAQTAMETHYNSGQTYVNGTAAALQDIEPSLAPGKGPTLSAPSSLTARAPARTPKVAARSREPGRTPP